MTPDEELRDALIYPVAYGSSEEIVAAVRAAGWVPREVVNAAVAGWVESCHDLLAKLTSVRAETLTEVEEALREKARIAEGREHLAVAAIYRALAADLVASLGRKK